MIVIDRNQVFILLYYMYYVAGCDVDVMCLIH